MNRILVPFVVAALASGSFAGDAAEPVGDPVTEPPTLHCLGAYWVIRGDDNRNATVTVESRKAGGGEWKPGPPLFRVERGATAPGGPEVPPDGWLFAGSVFDLEPATAYELALRATPGQSGAGGAGPCKRRDRRAAPDSLSPRATGPGAAVSTLARFPRFALPRRGAGAGNASACPPRSSDSA